MQIDLNLEIQHNSDNFMLSPKIIAYIHQENNTSLISLKNAEFLLLYSSSVLQKSRYRKTDLAVEFQIEKSASETWPRLTSERAKLPWLKIDFDKFPLDDSEENTSDVDNVEVRIFVLQCNF